MAQLNTEGMQMPVANKRAAQQVDSANQIALQQQMKAAGSKAPVSSGDIQGLAAQQTAQDTQTAQGLQAAEAQRTAAGAARDFQSQQMDTAESRIQDQAQLDQQRMDAEAQLATLGRDVKEKLLDKELALDERTGKLNFTNERQMADLALQMATDENDMKKRLQSMEQASKQRVQIAQFQAQAYTQAMEFASRDRQLAADQSMMRELAERQREAEAELAAAKKKAAVTSKVIGAATAVAGAVIAVYVPGGQAVGASMVASGASQVAGASE